MDGAWGAVPPPQQYHLFGGREQIDKTSCSRHCRINHFTRVPFTLFTNFDIECLNNGDVPIARELSDALPAKISWGFQNHDEGVCHFG
jgi:hypothetical protein